MNTPARNTEIERKFVVTHDGWFKHATSFKTIIQGYMSVQPAIRVRIMDHDAYITIKGKSSGFTCPEFEYSIPMEDAIEMTKKIEMGLIAKTRFYVPDGEHVWEIDVFSGQNDGLVIAEIEVKSEDDEINLTHDWLGAEVTNDPRYYNAKLSVLPYELWDACGVNA